MANDSILMSKGRKAEIKFYGPIGSWFGNNSSRMSDLIRNANKDHDEILIRMNSEGGEVQEAVAIYNVIKEVDAKVIIVVEGIAASAASFILPSADEVHMGRMSRQMIHKMAGGAFGDSEDMRNYADMMDSWENDVIEIYAEKMGISVEDTKAKYFQRGKDTWLSPKECLQLGLCDKIVDGKVEKKPDNAIKDVIELYNYYDIQLTNRSKPKSNSKSKSTIMEIEALKAQLGLPSNATEDQVNAKLNELKAAEKENVQLKAAKKEAEDKRLKNILDKAEKDGLIDSKAIPTWEDVAEKSGVDAVENALGSIKKPAVKVEDFIEKSGPSNSRKDWNLKEWMQKDPAGLAKMETEDPELFNKLQDEHIAN